MYNFIENSSLPRLSILTCKHTPNAMQQKVTPDLLAARSYWVTNITALAGFSA